MRATALRVAGAVVALALLLAGTGVRARDAAPANTTPLRLQLKWRHQFQFAGFYTALEKGYYRQAGLDVTITPLQPGTDPVDIVLARGADLGVASSELVLRYAKGDPVVVLATIFQHSPLALFVRSDIGIETPQDLAGHKVALAPWESEIFAYLQREHVSISQLQIVEHDHTVDSLLKGRVDALAGYETDESYYLQRSGRAFRQFTPRSSGVDFYGDTLFTSTRWRTRMKSRRSYTRSTHPIFPWKSCASKQPACCRSCAPISSSSVIPTSRGGNISSTFTAGWASRAQAAMST
jgi:ABC-type nitrate/sulfonate/bicarbonate transport system substrate-binding protein